MLFLIVKSSDGLRKLVDLMINSLWQVGHVVKIFKTWDGCMPRDCIKFMIEYVHGIKIRLIRNDYNHISHSGGKENICTIRVYLER